MYESEPVQTAVDEALRRVLIGLHPPVETDGVTGRAIYRPEPEHRGAPGWVHGGFAATVLDHFCARIASAALGMRVATGTFDLRYRQPITLGGGPYELRGEAEPPGSRTVRVRASIARFDGRPLTEARGLFVAVAPLEASSSS